MFRSIRLLNLKLIPSVYVSGRSYLSFRTIKTNRNWTKSNPSNFRYFKFEQSSFRPPQRFFGNHNNSRTSLKLAEKQRKELNKDVKKFISRVHPDLFGRHPEKKEINNSSLTLLNQFIDLTSKDHGNIQSVNKKFEFHFFCLPPVNSPQPEEEPFREIHYVVNMSKKMNKKLYEQNAILFGNEIIIELLEEASLMITKKTADSDVTDSRAEIMKAMDDSVRKWIIKPKEKMEKVVIDTHRHKSAVGKRGNKMYDLGYSMKEIVSSGFLHFGPDLSLDEKKLCLKRFEENLGDIEYENWRGVSLLFSKGFSRKTEGIIEVPYNFDIYDFKVYLRQHLEDIKNERQVLLFKAMQQTPHEANKA